MQNQSQAGLETQQRILLSYGQAMDDLIKLVRTYRLTEGLNERNRLAESIFRIIEPDLSRFVRHHVKNEAAQPDVLQEVLKSVNNSLKNFKNDTVEEFRSWFYTIARRRMKDQFRKEYSDRLVPMEEDEIRELIEASAQAEPISAGDRHDLDYAMKLLINAKPECYDYLMQRFIFQSKVTEIAEERELTPAAAGMKISRCLETVKALVA
jgi:RNA polymerase sigma factor (sigma-70 family)